MAKNRLAREPSPYLRGHQHSPIDWYPWGEEAISKARAEDKPIFLSVGYSTCYWCQVMARESFYDEGLAELLNRHFVCTLVDREERPDVDEVYTAATQVMTHGGGWPNTVFLTPDLVPFFCGTYFPLADRGPEQPGFARVVASMVHAWSERRGDVLEQAKELDTVLHRYLEDRGDPAAEVPPPSVAERAFVTLQAAFDPEWGGFGQGAKFPMPANLFLLDDLAGENPKAASMLALTLDRMARGGIFDQVAGGFHRHAVDRKWRVPHFDKLLADNGLLLELYARQLARTGDAWAARVVRRTAEFLDRDMSLDGGGFASAVGAGVDDGPEGLRHAWTRSGLVAVLGEEDTGFLAHVLGFDGPPFFEGDYYVLHLPQPLEEQAERRRVSRAGLEADLERLLAKLREARSRRPPRVDSKVLADWNGMAIAGLTAAGRVTRDAALVPRAARAADFVLAELRPDGRLRHMWCDGEARRDAFLADYVHLTRGVLALHEATGDTRWLEAARDLTQEQVERLGDARGGFFTAAASPELRWRSREVADGGLPAANAVAVLNLLELERHTGKKRYRELAALALRAFADAATHGEGTKMICLAARHFHRSPEPSS